MSRNRLKDDALQAQKQLRKRFPKVRRRRTCTHPSHAVKRPDDGYDESIYIGDGLALRLIGGGGGMGHRVVEVRPDLTPSHDCPDELDARSGLPEHWLRTKMYDYMKWRPQTEKDITTKADLGG